jgi:hypothetical protein
MDVQSSSRKKMSELARELRDRNRTVADLEDRLREENERIRAITCGDMVDVMHELDVSRFDIPADGNLPAMYFEMGNHYNASISSKWDEDRQEAAFDVLPDELLKIEVVAMFAKGEAQMARDLADELVIAGYTVTVKKSVHHSTLKAWVREQCENGRDLPDLETIGASIFNEVQVKEKRDG